MTSRHDPVTHPDEHNGWVNRETWATHLHLTNDYDLYHTSRRIVGDADASQREWMGRNGVAEFTGNFAGDALEEFVTGAVAELLHGECPTDWDGTSWIRMMVSDVGSFYRVVWNDVAAGLRDED